MYNLIAFNEVSANFTAHFGISISPYFDRARSNKSGRLRFITRKFVKYLIRTCDYAGEAHESLEAFICRRYGQNAWIFLKRLM